MELAPCPASPRCVSTEAVDPRHAVAPFLLARAEVWPELRAALLSLPRTRVVEGNDRALHAECRSAVFRFVDDLEVRLQPEAGMLAVRSASRLGRYDFGVNRRRVENLRRILRARGVVR